MQNNPSIQALLPQNTTAAPYTLPLPVQPAPMESIDESYRRPFSIQEKKLIDAACTVGGATLGMGLGLGGATLCSVPLWPAVIGTVGGAFLGLYSTTTDKFAKFVTCVAPQRSYNTPG